MEVYLSQENRRGNKNEGHYYATRDPKETYTVEMLAQHMAKHNTPFSAGTIKGILKDFVGCVRELVLEGHAVKIDNLAIFKASVENHDGWASLADVDLSIGGNSVVRAVRLLAQATGDFKKKELSGDASLRLTRDWREKVQKAKEEKLAAAERE